MNKERLEQIKKAYGQPMKDGNYPDEMIVEIERSWAITELAVKALEETNVILSSISLNANNNQLLHVVQSTIDEIRRMQK